MDRAAKTYLVDNFLAGGLPSLRSSVLACYGKFFDGVKNSAALEIRVVAGMAADDVRSTTGHNLRNIWKETDHDPRDVPNKVREVILGYRCPVPVLDTWRIPCLQKFMAERHRLEVLGEETSEVDALILSLVTS